MDFQEYRGSHAYKERACVASLEIARQLTRHDPRSEPLIGERVRHVVICGHPNATLISLVRTPEEFIRVSLLMNPRLADCSRLSHCISM
jgi:hypothetical protein